MKFQHNSYNQYIVASIILLTYIYSSNYSCERVVVQDPQSGPEKGVCLHVTV